MKRLVLAAAVAAALGGCATLENTADTVVGFSDQRATLTPRTFTYKDLTGLPKPIGKIKASVYNFRDQTGQYKSDPASNFSTAVTQGETALLTTAAAGFIGS